jgi:hypothetical protein
MDRLLFHQDENQAADPKHTARACALTAAARRQHLLSHKIDLFYIANVWQKKIITTLAKERSVQNDQKT